MTTYYDFVLGVIPLALFGLGGGLFAAGFPLELGLTVGGLLAIALIGHAIFVNAPVSSGSAPRRTDRPTARSADHPAPTPSDRRGPAPTSD
jgi:hypothetical protein